MPKQKSPVSKIKVKQPKSDSSAQTESTSRTPVKSTAEAWMARTNSDKRYQGRVLVRKAGDVQSPYMLRRSTGLLSLDLALGGGVHACGATEIKGVESAGKTYMAYRIAGEIQRTYQEQANILIACTEILPDKGFARQAGFCIDYSPEEIQEYERMIVEQGGQPFTPEEVADLRTSIGTVGVMIAANGEMLLQMIIEALEYSRDDPNQGWQLILIESLGALLSSDAEDKEVGENIRLGGNAGMITQFQNKAYPNFLFPRDDGRPLETTLLGINQARANFDGGLYGPKTRAAAGAHAWKHALLASIEFSRGADIKEGKDANTVVLGKEVRWKISKGKAGTHDGLSGAFNFYHVNKQDPVLWRDVVNASEIVGADIVTDVITTSKKMGIIEASGSWINWYEGKNQILKCQGIDKFATALMDHPELVQQLRDRCIKASGKVVKYR